MKIIMLEAENMKRLKAIRIEPSGSTVIIGGDNDQGKSSVLDCISKALGGKKLAPPQPVREGQKSGYIKCDLDGLKVYRTFKADGSTSLTVTAEDGAKYDKPQAMLDALIGSLSFDPLGFIQMEPAKQLKLLQELAGLDFTEIENKRAKLYEDRTLENRTIKNLQGSLAGLTSHDDAPDEEVSVAELTEELEQAREAQDVAVQARADVATCISNQRAAEDQIANARASMEELQETTKKKISDLQSELTRKILVYSNSVASLETGKAQEIDRQERLATGAEQLEAAVPDGHAIKEKIAGAEEGNRRVRANKEYAGAKVALEEAEDISSGLTREIETLDQEKVDTVAAAEFPVEGLFLGDDGVMFNNIPFEQASGAQQLRVSVAMGLAMNPELPVLLVHNGSLLDAASLKLLQELATEADAQVWIERVSQGDECTLIIEDGEVKEKVLDAQEA